jgi:LAO/AO transport system kinase
VKPFFVYLLECSDGSYYVGQTDDIASRLRQHDEGNVGYTSTRKPFRLAWSGEFATRDEAIGFEQRVKGWGRVKKQALIAGDWRAIQKHAWGTRNPLPAHLAGDFSDGGPSIPQGERVGSRDGPSLHLGKRGDKSGEPGLLEGVLEGEATVQRRAIAKAITLLESNRADHRAQADELLTALLPHTGKSFRLGLSGVPGVGKSTFIEVLGLHLIEQGHRVAVLTIDPSSTVSGGSILGDKTRMEKLSVHEKAYIRPSPSSGTLGGVAEKTREAMLVCEAAGYDIVIVETVGVGQSETAVANMTDMFVLMQLPNAGDDLQSIKKGVMELADLVVINKADLDADAAMRAQAQITSSLRLLGQSGSPDHDPHLENQWHPQVIQLSALLGQGVDSFWAAVQKFKSLQTQNGKLAARRQQQSLAWMWERIDAGLKRSFRENADVKTLLPHLTQDVAEGRVPPSVAARNMLLAHMGQAQPAT